MGVDKTNIKKLFQVLTDLVDEKDCEIFLNDLCTNKEIEQMAQRLMAAECLLNGDTYETVIKKTDISSATLSRVSRCVKYGEGYKKVLNANK
jgi:TrpR-related protein YerC/YecD